MIVIVLGDDVDACEQVVDLFHEWMDARLIQTEVFFAPTKEERKRPDYWRYWRALPPDGKIGLIFGGWALDALRERVLKGSQAAFERRLQHIRVFERALTDDGSLVLKFLAAHAQEGAQEAPEESQRLEAELRAAAASEREIYRHYDEIIEVGEELVRDTRPGPHALARRREHGQPLPATCA